MQAPTSTGTRRQNDQEALGLAQEVTGQRALRGVRKRVALFRIGFGLFWAIDAWYKWQPAFQHQFANNFSRPARGAPSMLQPWFHFWSGLVPPHTALFAPATAVIETLIAGCLILGLARRSLYLLGAVFAFLIWSVPESFGRFWTAGQTDLGTGIMYVFIFLALYLVDAAGSAGGWSLDRRVEARLPFWRQLAEP